jgi:hypothetical protein
MAPTRRGIHEEIRFTEEHMATILRQLKSDRLHRNRKSPERISPILNDDIHYTLKASSIKTSA